MFKYKIIHDTRPSIWGTQKCMLSEPGQERALKRFHNYYNNNANKMVWNNDKSMVQNSYKTVEDSINALVRHALLDSTENCVGFSQLLIKRLNKLGLPARMIWVAMDTVDQKDIGHALVVYQYKGKNYAADLCSAIKGCEKSRKERSFIWNQPFDKHMAAYSKAGLVTIQFGCNKYGINYFKEYDEIRAAFHRVSKKQAAALPFIGEDKLTREAQKKRVFKLDRNFVPKFFEQVSLANGPFDKDPKYNVPPELLAAMERDVSKYNNSLANYTFLGKVKIIAKRIWFEIGLKRRTRAIRAAIAPRTRYRKSLDKKLAGQTYTTANGEVKKWSDAILSFALEVEFVPIVRDAPKELEDSLKSIADAYKPFASLESHKKLASKFTESTLKQLKPDEISKVKELVKLSEQKQAAVDVKSAKVKTISTAGIIRRQRALRPPPAALKAGLNKMKEI